MRKQAVLFFGPPGAGKDTQANILQERHSFVHVQSSKIIKRALDEGDPNDKIIICEKWLWSKRFLNTSAWVTDLLIPEIRAVAGSGKSLVTSGSLRMLPEAKVLLPILEQGYGRNAITIFHLVASREVATDRLANRRVCEANKHPIPSAFIGEHCPEDGSNLIQRDLDASAGQRNKAFDEFQKHTMPVFDFFRDQGHDICQLEAGWGEEDLATHVRTVLAALAAAHGASAT